jgi:hypothetical protein
VQDVARHLAAINTLGLEYDGVSPFDNFDPRITPNDWMRDTEDEPPGCTLDRLRETSPGYFARSRSTADAGVDDMVSMPFGQEPRQVLTLHAFWDSWVHERDIVLPLGLEHRTDADGARYASSYALFISAAVASLFGTPVVTTFALSGLGAGVYDLSCHDRTVTVRADDGSEDGAIDAITLTESLSGRGAPVDGIPPALWSLANFFNTPV